jgi:hypothetical protein
MKHEHECAPEEKVLGQTQPADIQSGSWWWWHIRIPTMSTSAHRVGVDWLMDGCATQPSSWCGGGTSEFQPCRLRLIELGSTG